MNRTVQLIGDELHVDGMVVALLAQRGVPASVMADLVDGLENGTLFEAAKEEPLSPDERVDLGHEEREALLAHMTKVARGGLLRLADVCEAVNKHFDGEAL